MRIAGLQKLTLLDFPGKTAATVFTPGCNFRCPFCHNADLVTGEAARPRTAAPYRSTSSSRSSANARGCSTACASQAVNRCCSPVSMSSALACTSWGSP